MSLKFEAPFLRVITTSDGPVCFDLSKESEDVLRKDDILNSVISHVTVPFCQCQCTCECMAPCKCQCTCECTAPCNCQCTCECKTKGGDQCVALTVENDPFVQLVNPIERTGEKIELNKSFMFRKESFGGMLFDKENFVSYRCNQSAWEIFHFIDMRNGININGFKPLFEHLKATFQDTPANLELITVAFLHGCLKKTSRKSVHVDVAGR